MKKRISVTRKYGGFILLPPETAKLLPSMDAAQLKTFIYLCSADTFDPDDAAGQLGMTADEFETALAYCRGTGLFSAEDGAQPAPKLPSFQSYDSETLAGAVSGSEDFSFLVSEMGRILGKVMNKNDINLLYNLYDFENVPTDYICAVANYAVRRSRGSISYVVRTTLAIRDDGADTYEKLERYISDRERAEDRKTKLWSLLGFGSRTPSAKEKAYMTKWFDEYGMTYELVAEAYEITVDATGGAKLAYMSKILDDWFENGCTSPEQAKALRGAKNPRAGSANTSFDIDEMYAAAVKKGMGDEQ